MLLKYAVDTIQRQVKKGLGLKNTPELAKTASIKKKLAKLNFSEPFEAEQCNIIATMIIDQYQAVNRAITIVNTATDAIAVKPSEPEMTEETKQQAKRDLQMETSVQLTFQNNFEKASIIKTDLQASAIIVSDMEAIELAAKMPDTFESRMNFHNELLTLWQNLRLVQGQAELDEIINKITSIEAFEYGLDNQKRQVINGTVTRISTRHKQFDEDFKKTIIELMNQ